MRHAVQTKHEQTATSWACIDSDSAAYLKKKIVDTSNPDGYLEPIFSGQNITEEKTEEYIRPVIHPSVKQPVPADSSEIKKIARRTINNISTPSIKNALEGKFEENQLTAKEQHQIYSKEDEKEEFTLDELKVKWDAFLARLDDRPNLQSTLSNLPKLQENFELVLEIENTVQEDLISNIKPELVSWLRVELKNSKIQLTTVITQKVKSRIIYTDAEKYDELVKKNPSLALLRQKFNLDFGQ